ncbi:hypothetical protein HYV83_05210 [Candidatus Woesearchaeota archaeon]|nr:hypothetical protein [Candidatus Woesearchaeota archaeon]
MKKRRFTELSRGICFAAVVVAVLLLMQACKSSEGQNKAAVSTVVSQENQQARGQQAPEQQPGRALPANFQSMLAEAKPLCEQYKTATYAVKCEDVLGKVLLYSPGTVERIYVGTENVPVEAKGLVKKDMWLFEIRLQTPYVDSSGKQINRVRVGVGLNEDVGIVRMPLQ